MLLFYFVLGQVVIALLSVIPMCKLKVKKAMEAFGSCLEDKGILTSLLGPFILGMGMTLSGAVSNLYKIWHFSLSVSPLVPYEMCRQFSDHLQ